MVCPSGTRGLRSQGEGGSRSAPVYPIYNLRCISLVPIIKAPGFYNLCLEGGAYSICFV